MQLVLRKKHLGNERIYGKWMWRPNFELKWKPLTLKTTRKRVLERLMHQWIPAVPMPPPTHTHTHTGNRGEFSSRCQFRGWDIWNFIAVRERGICAPLATIKMERQRWPEKPLILGWYETQYVAMIIKLLSLYCGGHLVQSYRKESNISDTNWLRYLSSLFSID